MVDMLVAVLKEDGNSKSSTMKCIEPLLRKGTYPCMSCANTLAFLTYSTLMMTWKKTSETGLQTFPTQRSCMLTFTIKSMTCCTISFAHHADALDIISWTTLSSPSSTSDSPV